MISLLHLSDSQHPPGVLLFCLSLLLTGCTSISPPTVRRDRLDYADAMADASKRETLLNIVKLRYGDTPSMVTVNQLVPGYTLEGRVNLGSDFFRETFDLPDDVNIGIGGTFSDRPAITYAPIEGNDLARVMMNPIPPSELFAMLAGGMPADLTLGLGVQTLNGWRNWTVDARASRAWTPDSPRRWSSLASCAPRAPSASASKAAPACGPCISSWRTGRAARSTSAPGA